MSRFKTHLDTAKRSIIVIDTETDNKLHIRQQQSTAHWGSLELLDEEDQLVTYANDLQSDLDNAQIALQLFGDSYITFDDNKFPSLFGGIKLRNVKVHNPNFNNVDLRDFEAICSDECIISNSTIDELEWPHGSKLHISHCFINDKYREVKDRMSQQMCEWFMNRRVDGEMW